MATAESVKAKMLGLIGQANEATGKEDTDLTAAVGSLIAGFGQGGDTSMEDGLVSRTITEYVNDRVTTVGANAFSSSPLTKIHLGAAETIKSSAFAGSVSLFDVSIPNAKKIDTYAFQGCIALPEISLPKINTLGGSSFNGAKQLAKVDCGAITVIAANAFWGCVTLKTLILRGNIVVTLMATSAFGSTPFISGGTGGTVYIPAELIPEYQKATNWSTLYAAGTCNFVAIEGSEYE